MLERWTLQRKVHRAQEEWHRHTLRAMNEWQQRKHDVQQERAKKRREQGLPEENIQGRYPREDWDQAGIAPSFTLD